MFLVFEWLLGVLIIPNWLTMTSGHIAILFGTCLELPKDGPNIDPQAPYCLQKYLQKNKNNYGNML